MGVLLRLGGGGGLECSLIKTIGITWLKSDVMVILFLDIVPLVRHDF